MSDPARLAAAASLLYGERWQRSLARLVGRNDRLVRWWASGERPIPAWVWPLLTRALLVRRAAIENILPDLMPPRAPRDRS